MEQVLEVLEGMQDMSSVLGPRIMQCQQTIAAALSDSVYRAQLLSCEGCGESIRRLVTHCMEAQLAEPGPAMHPDMLANSQAMLLQLLQLIHHAVEDPNRLHNGQDISLLVDSILDVLSAGLHRSGRLQPEALLQAAASVELLTQPSPSHQAPSSNDATPPSSAFHVDSSAPFGSGRKQQGEHGQQRASRSASLRWSSDGNGVQVRPILLRSGTSKGASRASSMRRVSWDDAGAAGQTKLAPSTAAAAATADMTPAGHSQDGSEGAGQERGADGDHATVATNDQQHSDHPQSEGQLPPSGKHASTHIIRALDSQTSSEPSDSGDAGGVVLPVLGASRRATAERGSAGNSNAAGPDWPGHVLQRLSSTGSLLSASGKEMWPTTALMAELTADADDEDGPQGTIPGNSLMAVLSGRLRSLVQLACSYSSSGVAPGTSAPATARLRSPSPPPSPARHSAISMNVAPLRCSDMTALAAALEGDAAAMRSASGAASTGASPTRQGRYSGSIGGLLGSFVRGSVRSSCGAMDLLGLAGGAGVEQQQEQQRVWLAVAVWLLRALTALASDRRSHAELLQASVASEANALLSGGCPHAVRSELLAMLQALTAGCGNDMQHALMDAGVVITLTQLLATSTLSDSSATHAVDTLASLAAASPCAAQLMAAHGLPGTLAQLQRRAGLMSFAGGLAAPSLRAQQQRQGQQEGEGLRLARRAAVLEGLLGRPQGQLLTEQLPTGLDIRPPRSPGTSPAAAVGPESPAHATALRPSTVSEHLRLQMNSICSGVSPALRALLSGSTEGRKAQHLNDLSAQLRSQGLTDPRTVETHARDLVRAAAVSSSGADLVLTPPALSGAAPGLRGLVRASLLAGPSTPMCMDAAAATHTSFAAVPAIRTSRVSASSANAAAAYGHSRHSSPIKQVWTPTPYNSPMVQASAGPQPTSKANSAPGIAWSSGLHPHNPTSFNSPMQLQAASRSFSGVGRPSLASPPAATPYNSLMKAASSSVMPGAFAAAARPSSPRPSSRYAGAREPMQHPLAEALTAMFDGNQRRSTGSGRRSTADNRGAVRGMWLERAKVASHVSTLDNILHGCANASPCSGLGHALGMAGGVAIRGGQPAGGFSSAVQPLSSLMGRLGMGSPTATPYHSSSGIAYHGASGAASKGPSGRRYSQPPSTVAQILDGLQTHNISAQRPASASGRHSSGGCHISGEDAPTLRLWAERANAKQYASSSVRPSTRINVGHATSTFNQFLYPSLLQQAAVAAAYPPSAPALAHGSYATCASCGVPMSGCCGCSEYMDGWQQQQQQQQQGDAVGAGYGYAQPEQQGQQMQQQQLQQSQYVDGYAYSMQPQDRQVPQQELAMQHEQQMSCSDNQQQYQVADYEEQEGQVYQEQQYQQQQYTEQQYQAPQYEEQQYAEQQYTEQQYQEPQYEPQQPQDEQQYAVQQVPSEPGEAWNTVQAALYG